MNRRELVHAAAFGAAGLALPSHAAAAAKRVQVFDYPRLSPRSSSYKVWVDGQPVFPYQTTAATFASFACDGAVTVEVELASPPRGLRIAPSRHGIAAKTNGNRFSFRMAKAMNLFVESEGVDPLFVFASAIDEAPPRPGTRGLRHFAAGQVYEIGELRLGSDESVYVEGGAVVRGCLRATNAERVRIGGPGVLDGSYYNHGEGRRSIVLEGCKDARIDDLIIVEPSSWTIMLGACDGVTLRNVRELGFVAGSDGCDIVGSRRVRVEGCCFRNGDDCIAVKSLDMRRHGRDATISYAGDVDDVEIVGCSFLAYLGGTAMEIGHELRTASVRNVRFRDCDVLKKPQYGAAFGIHNADRAVVSDVLWQGCRVEHHYDKLVDLRIIESRWSEDKQRGQIRNVTFRDIDVLRSPFNAGYTTSLIGGFDAAHTVEHVRFERFRVDGKVAKTPDDFDLYLRHAGDVTFA